MIRLEAGGLACEALPELGLVTLAAGESFTAQMSTEVEAAHA